MSKLLIIMPCLIIMFQPLNAKVEAPNYHFELTTLDIFFPGKSTSEVESKFGVGEVTNKQGELRTVKYVVKEKRYQFPVIAQFKNDRVLDFFARLPSYFLHDVFFQSLVNRLGKQTKYKKVGEEAYYTWETKGQLHVYSAACTITCFPIFYSVRSLDSTEQSLLHQMQKSNQ